MDIILLHDGIYTLVPLNYDFDFTVMNFFEYCDAFREAMATFDEELNRWITKNGQIFFGCLANS